MTENKSRDQQAHDENVNLLLSNPNRLNLEERIVMSGSLNFFNDNGNLISQPDGVLFGKNGGLYIFEYKLTNGNSRDIAILQLKKDIMHARKYLHLNPQTFYITGPKGQFHIEEMYL